MIMKKFLVTALVVLMAGLIPCLAQSLGHVKREGGYTNVRRGPGSSYGIATKVKDGSTIYYEYYNSSWYKVYNTAGDYLGYMHSSKIVADSYYSAPAATPNYSVAYVKREGGYTNIRRGPGTNYGVAQKVRDGSAIYVSYYNRSWYKVYSSRGSLIGYIHSSKVVGY